ncbi:MAG: hypothetical protein ACOCUI_01900 [bacterium]
METQKEKIIKEKIRLYMCLDANYEKLSDESFKILGVLNDDKEINEYLEDCDKEKYYFSPEEWLEYIRCDKKIENKITLYNGSNSFETYINIEFHLPMSDMNYMEVIKDKEHIISFRCPFIYQSTMPANINTFNSHPEQETFNETIYIYNSFGDEMKVIDEPIFIFTQNHNIEIHNRDGIYICQTITNMNYIRRKK